MLRRSGGVHGYWGLSGPEGPSTSAFWNQAPKDYPNDASFFGGGAPTSIIVVCMDLLGSS